MGRPETGRTGARFGAPARRAREEPEPAAVEEPVADDPAADDGVGLTGARFGGRSRRPRKDRPSPPAAEAAGDVPAAATTATAEDDDARPTVELPRIDDAAPDVRVAARPYVITGGRTKVRSELRIETMVSALGPPAGEAGERYTVLRLCERPRSVSEVAALTGVPLGVARVLIDDLASEGRVRVHLGVDAASGPDMELLDRVLAGLRRL